LPASSPQIGGGNDVDLNLAGKADFIQGCVINIDGGATRSL